jgi:hypothetical protein
MKCLARTAGRQEGGEVRPERFPSPWGRKRRLHALARQGDQDSKSSGAGRLVDFEQALTARARARVRFVIMGGLAVTIHGSSYVAFGQDFRYAHGPEILQATR